MIIPTLRFSYPILRCFLWRFIGSPMWFVLLMLIICATQLIAEEKNKATDYTWLQYIGKKSAECVGISLSTGISCHIAQSFVHPDDSTAKIGIVYGCFLLASIVGGVMAGGTIADKIMGKQQEEKEPELLFLLMQNQLSTKEDLPTEKDSADF